MKNKYNIGDIVEVKREWSIYIFKITGIEIYNTDLITGKKKEVIIYYDSPGKEIFEKDIIKKI